MGYFTHLIEPPKNEVSVNGHSVELDCSALSEYELVIKDRNEVWGEKEPYTGREYDVPFDVVEALFSEAQKVISSLPEALGE